MPAIAGGASPKPVRTTCVCHDGDVRFCDWFMTPSGDGAWDVLVKDVTREVHAMNDLCKLREKARGLFNSVPIGVFQADARNELVVVNPELAWMLGYESTESLGASVSNVSGLFYDEETAESFLFQLYEGEQISRFRCSLRRREGNPVWALCYGQVTRNSDRRFNGFYGFVIDISRTKRAEEALKKANHELRLASILDGLTRIANRRRFDECLASEWCCHQREQEGISLILCDIDHFKRYNDTYGHQAGDQCLQRIAQTLSTCVQRSGDLVARYGGEEFAVILPRTDHTGARHVAEMMRQKVEQLAILHESSDTARVVTLSLGVASMRPSDKESAENLIRYADQMLYLAKDNGRNRVTGSAF